MSTLACIYSRLAELLSKIGSRNKLISWYSVRMNTHTICCFCSVTKLCLTVCNPMDCSTPGLPVLHHLSQFTQTHVHWVGDAIQPSHPLLPLLLLPSVFPSIRVFSSELALPIRWPKYWSFSISPSNEYSGLVSFWIDWFNLLAVQGTLKSLLQHHSLIWKTLISAHDYLKSHSFDCMDLPNIMVICKQKDQNIHFLVMISTLVFHIWIPFHIFTTITTLD